jgi:hypothetical protein
MLNPQPRTLAPTLAETWPLLQPPLRPSAGDLAAFQQVIDEWVEAHHGGTPRALILGATPELWELAWPDRTKVCVIEPDPEVARQLWPGPERSLRVARWLTTAPTDGPFDIVFCDAGLHTLGFPAAQTELCRRLAAVMPAGGQLAMRLITPPSQREPSVRVVSELWAGNIPDMSQLVMRLCHALQQSPAGGVRADAVWLKLRSLCKDWETLLDRTGWSSDSIGIAELLRFSTANYHFVTLVEVLDMFVHGHNSPFEMSRLVTGGGPMAVQCPVLTLEKH